MFTYCTYNNWLIDGIERAYDQTILGELSDATTTAQAADTILEFTETDPTLRRALHPWVSNAIVLTHPASKQLEDLFGAISGGESDPTGKDRRKVVRDLIVDRRQGWRVFWVSSPHSRTGEDVVKAVEALDSGSWRKTLEVQDNHAAKRAILVRFSDRLLAQMRDPIRALNRITGWVQWTIIYLFWLILVTVFRRWVVLWRLGLELAQNRPSDNWTDILTDDRYRGKPWPSEANWYRDGFSRLRTMLENDVYGTFSFLLGLLPSFGFIGTVLGIGNALLAASGLFNQRNKEGAIGEITLHLGYAFDATLLALLLGAVAGVVAVIYRLYEQGCLRKWEGKLLKKCADIKEQPRTPSRPNEQDGEGRKTDGREMPVAQVAPRSTAETRDGKPPRKG